MRYLKMTSTAHRAIAVAHGDGVGPEIMAAVLAILEAASARIKAEPVRLGEQVYKRGISEGIEPQAWEVLQRDRVLLKAPLSTPRGRGIKSPDSHIRKVFGLFANVRPILTAHSPQLDLVIVREHQEEPHVGMEHRQTPEVTQCLKLISRPGSERLIRCAFDYARQHGRGHVTCMTQHNHTRLSEGLLHKLFHEIGAAEYPDIDRSHRSAHLSAALLKELTQRRDVILAPELRKDTLCDLATQVEGAASLAGSADIGEQFAMFETAHGSAHHIAGRDLANPSGLLQAAVMMLMHLGQEEVAAQIQSAWRRTIEDGIHTADLYRRGVSSAQVGTRAFAKAVIERLHDRPRQLPSAAAGPREPSAIAPTTRREEKRLVGIDISLDWDKPGRDAEQLARALRAASKDGVLELKMMTNCGVKVWPDCDPVGCRTDQWRCRFMLDARAPSSASLSQMDNIDLMCCIALNGFDIIKTESLYTFDGVPGFS
jgi:isocitrate dehydrogenase